MRSPQDTYVQFSCSVACAWAPWYALRYQRLFFESCLPSPQYPPLLALCLSRVLLDAESQRSDKLREDVESHCRQLKSLMSPTCQDGTGREGYDLLIRWAANASFSTVVEGYNRSSMYFLKAVQVEQMYEKRIRQVLLWHVIAIESRSLAVPSDLMQL